MNEHRRWQEATIIAQWLRGEHEADIRDFLTKDFKYFPKVVGYIKEHGVEGFFRSAIKEEIVTREEYREIYNADFPSLYETHVKEILTESAKEWISQNPSLTAEEIESKMQKISRHIVDVPHPLQCPPVELVAEFDRRLQENIVTTGLSQLDQLLCGVRAGELTFVGARPSVGKSAFLLQVAESVANQGKKVLYLSLEMPELAMWQRLFLRKTFIPSSLIRRGKIDWSKKENSDALEDISRLHESGNFVLLENTRDVGVIRELISIHKPYMLVIDQLQQMDDKSQHFRDVRSRFSYMTRFLQEVALGQNIAVWCACQINRAADDSVPTMANLKEAGNIEEDATNVILLHRESDKVERQIINCELAKQKEGACGDVKLSFHAPTFTFTGTVTEDLF